MPRCSHCGHDEVTHFNWIGCCGQGLDGMNLCHRDTHGGECWWTEACLPRPPLTRDHSDEIFYLQASGLGTRPIARQTGIKRSLVIAVLHEDWWPRPNDLPAPSTA